MNKRVLLGMSGGIDSSVSAMLLKEQGYKVIGITFLFSGSDEQNHHFLKDAVALADSLNIQHLTVDLRKEFEEYVIKYFIDEYQNGRTPFPCAYCNPNLKFNYLNKYAIANNCDSIATGHYVKTGLYNGKKYLFQGDDPEKDQSFFLWGLPREIVDKLIFPLGNFEKTEIRNLANERGYVTLAKKKDSLGICFIEGNDYRHFLKKRGIKSEPGNFVDENGNILGEHSGIFNYTIGQRRGLGLNLNFPLFVSEFRLDDNEIVLTKYDDLYRSKLRIENYYIIDNEIVDSGVQLIVKVRYRLQETLCSLHILNDTEAEVELLQPEAMIAPGQTAVFYHNDRLVGGGFIKSAE
ncbi:tRNA 2-thiouridine(34) synthase MnmA [Draconibacterium sp. IB214405]|uniref:tRNA 2-thiouridine(34) synthase MnmA n=1 Tax=Draconibacterium sp. IB214405 TaxID=3097352 RepID=UPI002A0B2825|nr:tRNA 2-thiouridine(34) synthase MnmA [Draconibacterium sp. IB214405]MDX8337806.1 tRNA 2-thiouridine(34) synthase MnmA [Draconibacterium sp. IB214405]